MKEPKWDWGQKGEIKPPFVTTIIAPRQKRASALCPLRYFEYSGWQHADEGGDMWLIQVFANRRGDVEYNKAPWWVLRIALPGGTSKKEAVRQAQVWLDVVKMKWGAGDLYD
jgi:hypothetical protein